MNRKTIKGMRSLFRKLTFLKMVILVGAFALLFTACPDDTGDEPAGDRVLSGNISIAYSSLTAPTTLTANYTGNETVSYQWKRGSTDLGTASTQSAAEAGSYTVTVSAAGYQSKTSAAVNVTTGGGGDPVLTGNIVIKVNDVTVTTANVGDTLTASYSGSETITVYQWKKDGTNVGTNSAAHLAAEAGSYTVTVSATGYQSKTSVAVTVSSGGGGTVAKPTATPPAGTYNSGQSVTLNTTTVGATIHYTVDGSTPNASSPQYAAPISITQTRTLKAIAVLDGESSEMLEALYTIEAGDPIQAILDHVATLANNTAATPHNVEVNVTGLTQAQWNTLVLGLNSAGKFVSLDLTGSTGFATIEAVTAPATTIVGLALGSSTMFINQNAFQNWVFLRNMSIPGVMTIGIGAWSGCLNLQSITIPASVMSIGAGAFTGCNNLKDITIETTQINCTTSNNWGTMFTADDLTVTFNADIGANALYGCTRLVNLIIGNNVTSIGAGAFTGCTNLENITIENTSVNCTQGSNWGTMLAGIPTDANITFNVNIGDNAFYECTWVASVTIGNSVTDIGDSAFYSCTSLTSVTIGNSVTRIWFNAFNNSGLTSIIIPNSVINIDIAAFWNCYNLTSVTFEGTNTNIGNNAFLGDLRSKYNGTGTYTTSNPGNSAVWTKQ